MTISNDYQEVLQRKHGASTNWGSTAGKYAGAEVLQQVFYNQQIQEMLDYGAGKQALKPFVERYIPHVAYHAYDPGVPEIADKPKGKYGIVTCIDVLEHVEKEFTEEVVREIGRYAKYTVLLDIACYPTGQVFEEGPHKGKDLHINLCPPDTWASFCNGVLGDEFQLAVYAPTIMYRRNGTERPRCTLIYHRKY